MTRGVKSSSQKNIGQLLIIGFDATELTPRLSFPAHPLQPAGVILFARNIKSSRANLASPPRLPKVRLHAAIHLRRPRRRPGRSLPRCSRSRLPSAAEVFATRDRKLFRKHGQARRRKLPRPRLQPRLRSRPRSCLRSLAQRDEFPCRFRQSA